MKTNLLKIAFFIATLMTIFSSCKKDDKVGEVPDSVIPAEIRSQLDSLMPIYSGTTPPDISGEFLVTPAILVGSSLETDASMVGISGYWADLYLAFIKSNGKYAYYEQNASASGSGDDVTVTVTVVGKNKNFTAYFIDNTTDPNSTAKMSTVISGTMTSNGISDFYYAFIMLEKNDPTNELVPVDTYRVFKDGDGLVESNNWYSSSQSQLKSSSANQQITIWHMILQK